MFSYTVQSDNSNIIAKKISLSHSRQFKSCQLESGLDKTFFTFDNLNVFSM